VTDSRGNRQIKRSQIRDPLGRVEMEGIDKSNKPDHWLTLLFQRLLLQEYSINFFIIVVLVFVLVLVIVVLVLVQVLVPALVKSFALHSNNYFILSSLLFICIHFLYINIRKLCTNMYLYLFVYVHIFLSRAFTLSLSQLLYFYIFLSRPNSSFFPLSLYFIVYIY
jgi:hypothetical protein